MVVKSSTFTQFSTQRLPWCLGDSYDFVACFSKRKIENCSRSYYSTINHGLLQQQSQHQFHSTTYIITSSSTQRKFHNYFLTNLSSTASHHSDSPSPRSSSSSATATAAGFRRNNLSNAASNSSSQALRNNLPSSNTNFSSTNVPPRDLIVVRIPLKSAKQHFGVCQSRGNRPSNEDTYQAGIIEIPAFAKKGSVNHPNGAKSLDVADSASGGPQVFGFGVFDGHGGNECSEFLKENLYEYIEKTADLFELESSLQSVEINSSRETTPIDSEKSSHQEILVSSNIEVIGNSSSLQKSGIENTKELLQDSIPSEDQNIISNVDARMEKIFQLEKSLIKRWSDTVGGYFRRFKPKYFSDSLRKSVSIESVLMYAFLKTDFDFISDQAHKAESFEENKSHSLVKKNKDINIQSVGSTERFLGGSTASIALISTPTPMPFWHPSSPSTLLIAHVGDTRIILCNTATGLAKPCTTDHHPSTPGESTRMRRYATSFVTDSFGEERVSGLANTRAFGDIHSKRIGVSAEPDIHRIELMAAEYSMLVLVSDGIGGTLNDQEIVDIVKESKTPEQGASDVVAFATEVSKNGDNATCLVVRLGGWEKRREGGLGSLGTMECREWRRRDASDMRRVERHR